MDERVYEQLGILAIMGGTRPEREDARARTAYIAAARRYLAALSDVHAAGVPLVARGGTGLPSWSRIDVQVMLELHAALGERPSQEMAGHRSGYPESCQAKHPAIASRARLCRTMRNF